MNEVKETKGGVVRGPAKDHGKEDAKSLRLIFAGIAVLALITGIDYLAN